MDTNDWTVLASDLDREAACRQINVAFSEGRLTDDEQEDWTERALRSRKRGELQRLINGLPNPTLPELPPKPKLKVKKPPPDWKSLFTLIILVAAVLYFAMMISLLWPHHSSPKHPMPTPAASITDPQDRAFVQMMITYHNSADHNPDLYDDRNPYQDIDEAAVLDIARQIRDPHTDIRQEFLLAIGSAAFRHLTLHERYYAGKTALSIWRPDQEAVWIQLGNDQGYGG